MHHGGASQAELLRQLLVRRLGQVRTVAEDDRRDDPLAAVAILDEPDPFLVAIDVVPIERHPLIGEELLRATTVGAPTGAVELDLGHAGTLRSDRPSVVRPGAKRVTRASPWVRGPGRRRRGPPDGRRSRPDASRRRSSRYGRRRSRLLRGDAGRWLGHWRTRSTVRRAT